MFVSLEDALQFNAIDLAANRQGYLTQEQRERLYVSRLRVGSVLRHGIVLMIAIALCFVTRNTLGAAFILLAATLGMVMLSLQARNIPDLQQSTARVAQVRGVVQRNTINMGQRTQHVIRVEGLSFKVSEAQYYAFKDRSKYILYYLPQTYTLLSAELLAFHDETTDETLSNRAYIFDVSV